MWGECGNYEGKCGAQNWELLDGDFVVIVEVLVEVYFLELNLPVHELEIDFCRRL
jgi:hypothetical protein